MGVTDGTVLERPLIEFCYKKDELDDPLIAKEHIFAFNWATEEEIKIIEEMTFRINDFMSGMCRGVGIKLVDFKLEFGICKKTDELVLADEISPDTCRLWDLKTNKKLDKDRFRRDLGNIEEAYEEVLNRLNLTI